MAAAPVQPGRRFGRLAAVATIVAVTLAPDLTARASGTSPQHGIPLPRPVHEVDPLPAKQLLIRPDRLLKSQVPGRVNDREDVRVELGPTGAPTAVIDSQQLVIHGAGNYIVRELGPAREAVGLGDTVPPVLELGTVVWQGFSPGTRALSARLTLDPGIEAARLPMSVTFAFRDRAGHARPLRPGAVAPADGTVTISLQNNTVSHRVLATGVGRPASLARELDRLRLAASRPRAAVPPTAGQGLPGVVPGRTTGALALDVAAPLRVTGTIAAPGGGAAVTGPGLIQTTGGASVAGTLTATATFDVAVKAGDRVQVRLDVRPWLDPRTLEPPAPASSWRQWARGNPSQRAVRAATQTLVATVAATARSAEYSPYLQADVPGPDLSIFTYVVAAAPRVSVAAAHMRPRPGGIAAAAVALLAILGNAAVLRRRL